VAPAVHRFPLLVLSAVLFACVTVLVAVVRSAGLGVGHFYYIPILLAAVAGGPWIGLCAGAIGIVLYDVAMVLNPALPSSPVWAQTAIRLLTFAAVGGLVGYFARRNDALVGELRQLATRDVLTGLPNTRAFEAAIERRLAAGTPFTLAIGDVDELRRINAGGLEQGDDALRRLADRLLATRHGEDEVARVGSDEFAVLSTQEPGGARTLALGLEQQLEGVTFGWASYPDDGENALALFRAADERLYARKMARGYRRG
jgi:diguanylate cyclase (GGDEF)-like protein